MRGKNNREEATTKERREEDRECLPHLYNVQKEQQPQHPQQRVSRYSAFALFAPALRKKEDGDMREDHGKDTDNRSEGERGTSAKREEESKREMVKETR